MNRLFTFILSTAFLVILSVQASETVKEAKKDIEAFKTEMAVKLEKVEGELKDLHTKAEEKSSEAQKKFVSEMEQTRDQLKAELEKADESANKNWKKFKKDFADSVDHLNSRIQRALKE